MSRPLSCSIAVFKAGIVRRLALLGRQANLDVDAEHLQAASVERLEHLGNLLRAGVADAVVAEFLEHRGLIVRRNAAVAGAVVEGEERIGHAGLGGVAVGGQAAASASAQRHAPSRIRKSLSLRIMSSS